MTDTYQVRIGFVSAYDARLGPAAKILSAKKIAGILGPAAKISAEEKTANINSADSSIDFIVSSAGLGSKYMGIQPEMKAALLSYFSKDPYFQSLSTLTHQHDHSPIDKEFLTQCSIIFCMKHDQIAEIRSKGLEFKLKNFTETENDACSGIPIYTLSAYAGDGKKCKDAVIRAVHGYRALSNLSYFSRSIIYGILGRIDPKDEEAVRKANLRVVKNLDKCVKRAMEGLVREIKEGKISAQPLK